MQVTKISPQKFRKNFFNIYLDCKFAFSLNADEILKSRLKVGSEISDVDAQKFIKIKKEIDATDRLYRYIGIRPRSEKEVKDHFKDDKLVEKAKSLNLINDLDFAKWWVEQRQTFRPKGKILLKIELKQKGISDETINEVLSNFSSDDKQILSLAQKKISRYKNLPILEQKQKLLAFLLRRGFDFDEAKSTVDYVTQKD